MSQQKFHRGNTVEIVRDITGCELTRRLIGLEGQVTGVRRNVDPDVDGTVNVRFYGHTAPILFYEEELLLAG